MSPAGIVAVAALLVAMAALAHSRRIARKLAILEEQYWELKLAHGELKAKAGVAPKPQPNFVPLIRRPPTPPAPGPGGTSPPRQ